LISSDKTIQYVILPDHPSPLTLLLQDRRCLFHFIMSILVCRILGRPRTASIRIAGNATEIRIWHLRNAGTHSASYPVGTGGSYPWVKAAGAWNSPLISICAEIKNAWCYTSTHPYVFMAWFL